MRFWWGCVLVASLGACAARGPSPQLVAALSDADGLIRQGCHHCLEDAVGRLTAHTAPASATPPAWADRLFEAQLLLALRQRELGIANCRAVWYRGLIHTERAAALERSPDSPEVKASAAAERLRAALKH